MAENDKKISQLDAAASIPVGSLFVVSVEDQESESGYISQKATSELLASQLLNSYLWPLLLDTNSKNVIGAVNELNSKVYIMELTGTLTAGQTQIELYGDFDPDSTVEIYTDVYGVSPESVVVSEDARGTVLTMTFEVQSSNLGVKARIY